MQMMETGSDVESLLEVLLEVVLKKSIFLQLLPVLVCQEDNTFIQDALNTRNSSSKIYH